MAGKGHHLGCAMKFVVVIASIRQGLSGFDETMLRIKSTFVDSTEFHLLDGADGKAQALNRASDEILAKTDADCYVTMDDDIVPAAGWQVLIKNAFESLPKYGAFGLWMGDDPDRKTLVGATSLDPIQTEGSVSYRRVRPPHHLNGGFIAYRTDVARQVGIIPTEGVRYQLWEDAWRGRRVTQLGWEMAFVYGVEVDMVDYPDRAEYLAMKKSDLAFGKAQADRVLAESGLGDSAALRFRKWVAKVRGRA